MEKTLEAWYCVPPDRDGPVVQVALAGRGPVWGEVRLDAGRLVVEVFGRSDGEPLILPADELREILRLAEETSRHGRTPRCSSQWRRVGFSKIIAPTAPPAGDRERSATEGPATAAHSGSIGP